MLEAQEVRRPISRTRAIEGMIIAAKIAMIAMTHNSSISVKPEVLK